mmetsp:Transcript_28897/g.73774  ORF Transcript_28897/g.73774 Transcript_28897/m.73774 type:complete len:237 (-) Transcript_28897:667-1377(-)
MRRRPRRAAMASLSPAVDAAGGDAGVGARPARRTTRTGAPEWTPTPTRAAHARGASAPSTPDPSPAQTLGRTRRCPAAAATPAAAVAAPLPAAVAARSPRAVATCAAALPTTTAWVATPWPTRAWLAGMAAMAPSQATASSTATRWLAASSMASSRWRTCRRAACSRVAWPTWPATASPRRCTTPSSTTLGSSRASTWATRARLARGRCRSLACPAWAKRHTASLTLQLEPTDLNH